MLFQCLTSVEDGVPALKQLWVNAPCLLGHKASMSVDLNLDNCHIELKTLYRRQIIGVLDMVCIRL